MNCVESGANDFTRIGLGVLVVEIFILGPLEVRAAGRPCVPTAPKVRTVLATLGVHAGQVVPVATLIRELWEHEPPASALTTLQTYILNLRKLLISATGCSAEEIAREVLVTKSGGYQLQIDPLDVDVTRHHYLVDRGNLAVTSGDHRLGVRHLEAADRLWRGPALVDVQVGRVLESKRLQFEEYRLLALEYLIQARLAVGALHEALTELVVLTADHPVHEGLHLLYMRALQHAGRRAQALTVYRRLRDNLVDQLGLEPSPSVQAVQQELLRSGHDVPRQAADLVPADRVCRTVSSEAVSSRSS